MSNDRPSTVLGDEKAQSVDFPPGSHNATSNLRDGIAAVAPKEGGNEEKDAETRNDVEEESPSVDQGEAGDEEQATSAPAEAPTPTVDVEAGRTKLQTIILMLALCSSLFLAALDISIITTAVPTIAAEFRSNLGYTWIGSAFILANGAVVPIWGKISDIWGRKTILLIAIAVFWVGSLVCGLSRNMATLIAGRAVQGVGGGGIITLINICISDLFSPRNRGFYFGIVSTTWAVASAIGPVLGGIFTSKATWRWCFYINLPTCGVAMPVLYFVLKLHNPRTPIRQGLTAIDWLGSMTIVASTIMFLLGLEFGGVEYPWRSATVICLLTFGGLMAGIFVLVEWKVAKYPITPLFLFKDRNSVAALSIAFIHAFVFLSGSYFLPLYFQAVLAETSLQSGIFLLPFVLPLSIVSVIAGFSIKKTGNYKIPIVVGMTIATVGFGLFVDLEAEKDLTKIIIYQIVAGIGIGPNFQSPLIALQSTVEPRDIASATATFSFARQMGGAISIVLGGALFDNGMQRQFPELLRSLGPETADRLSGENASASVVFINKLSGEEAMIARRAYLKALQAMYIMYVAVSGVGVLTSLMIRQKKLSKQHTVHKTGLKTLRSREQKT